MSDTSFPLHPSNTPTPGDPPTFLSDAMDLLRQLKLTATDDGSTPHAVSTDGLPTVPGYEILGELGRGGMGVVYKAHQIGLNRVVALKMILAAKRAGTNELIRFLAEAEAVAAVAHPNVVKVFELGHCDGRPYFAMEFVPGGSLSERLRPPDAPARRLAPGEAATLIAAVARGVHAAHDVGIVHRDLKPGNVLLAGIGEPVPADGFAATRSGASELTPKVSDFGLAKRLSSELTLTKAVLGTPAYMAPEQAGGKAKFVGPAADVYALGVILYDCLTGTVPFTGDEWSILSQVVKDAPEPPGRRVAGLPRDLELICLRCLEKEPHHRYPTAAALADDLEAFAGGRPVSVRQLGVVTRTWRWANRNRPQAAFAGLLVALALVVPPLLIWNRGVLAASDAAAVGAKQAQAEAEKLAAARELFALESGVRRRSANRPTGWTWDNRADLARAASLAVADAAPVTDLRSEVVAAALAADLRAAEVPAVVKSLTMSVAAASPDGKTVALGEFKAIGLPKVLGFDTGTTATVRLIEAATGARVRELSYPVGLGTKKGGATGQDGTRAVVFSPDGRRLFVGTRGGRVYRFDLDSPSKAAAMRWSSFETPVEQLAVSPDGRSLYGRTEEAPTFYQWDATTGTMLGQFTTDGGTRAVVVEPVSGDVIVSDGSHLHRLSPALKPRGEKVPIPEGHPRILEFAGGGRVLLAACGDTVVVIDPVGLYATARFLDPDLRRSSHQSSISALAPHPSGAFVATACSIDDDRQVKVWEVASGRRVAAVTVPGTVPIGLAWSGDGKTLHVTAPGRVLRFAFAAPDAQRFACFHPSHLEAASLSADGGRVAAVGRVSSSPAPRTLVVSKPDGGAAATDLPGFHLNPRTGVALDPRSDRVMVSAQVNRLLECRPGAEVAALEEHPAAPSCPRFSPDGSALWQVSDATVSVWDADGRTKRGEWANEFDGMISGLAGIDALAVGRTRAIAGGRNGSVYVLQDQGQKLAKLANLQHPGDPVLSVALSPDEAVAAAGTMCGKVRLCRLADEDVRILDAHAGGVTGVSFSRDGALLATGGKDRVVKVWRRSGDAFEVAFAAADLPSPVLSVEFSRDGDALLVLLMNEHAARVWDVARLRAHLDGLKLGW